MNKGWEMKNTVFEKKEAFFQQPKLKWWQNQNKAFGNLIVTSSISNGIKYLYQNGN